MDFFDVKYYRINKNLLKICGLWPFQSYTTKCFAVTFLACSYISLLIPQMICYIKLWGESLDGIMVRTLPLLTTLLYAIKLLTCILSSDKIKNILNTMKSHWELISSEPEFDQFLKQAQIGRDCSIIYIGYIGLTTIFYLCMPLIPCLIDQIAPLNETRERIFIYELDYGVEDNRDYFYWIQLHIFISAFSKIIPPVGFDTLFLIFTQHASGIFFALGNKLKNINKNIPKAINSVEEEDIISQEISKCVERHCIGLEFISSIESLFAISYLLQILTTVVIISLIGILVLINLDKPHEAVRFVLFVVAHMFSLFYLSLSSQRLTDNTCLLFDNIYFSRWYNMPLKCRKMLLQIMMKTKDSCKITAAQIYVMDIESFSGMIRASMSYFTMLSSMR
ncbi:odorant receptor 4-like [Leptopilina boulardi]|uniref:odorant receptor 4-like n=1 Tax=Leptopilina boulardi TaxID=63433 RepID=UPI0021F5CE2E|nr:odorant receptor 4-like [Leptopilina boulardi]